jgi:hypothetical protein
MMILPLNQEEYNNKALSLIKKGSIVQMITLVVHYLLGMATNVYIIIPAQDPLSILFQWQTIVLGLHILTGFIALACEIIMMYYSIRIHQRLYWILNLAGAIIVGLAIHAGAEFYLYGQGAFWSMWMAALYIAVVLVDFAQYVFIRVGYSGNSNLAVKKPVPAEDAKQ